MFKKPLYDIAMKDKQSFVPLFYLSSFSKSLCKKASATHFRVALVFMASSCRECICKLSIGEQKILNRYNVSIPSVVLRAANLKHL